MIFSDLFYLSAVVEAAVVVVVEAAAGAVVTKPRSPG